MIELWAVLLYGLSLGFLGGFHCVGMCGPLALSLPTQYLSTIQKYFAFFLYHIGRAFTYTTMGILLGVIGQGFSLFKLQQVLSVGGGILMLLFVFFYYIQKSNLKFFEKPTQQLNFFIGKQFKKARHPFSFFMIGMANGLLPCGLVYAAIIAALSLGTIYKSAALMLGFGMGTIPLLLLTQLLGKFLSPTLKSTINKTTPILLALIGILLILRGLDLGIPYLSPSMTQPDGNCH